MQSELELDSPLAMLGPARFVQFAPALVLHPRDRLFVETNPRSMFPEGCCFLPLSDSIGIENTTE